MSSPFPLIRFTSSSLSQLLLTPLWPDWQPLGMLLPVDMQSTSLSNQYLWKVVTNGPQGEESTLNTYKASAGILQRAVGIRGCHILFFVQLRWQSNVYKIEIQPIHLTFIVSMELLKWLNIHNAFLFTSIYGCCALLAVHGRGSGAFWLKRNSNI